jgi:protein phosphatase
MNNFVGFDTQPFDSNSPAGRERPRSRSTLDGVDFAGRTHAGNVRSTNEDHFLIIRFGRFLETVATNLEPGDVEPSYTEMGLGMATADGMGGHAAGDQASRLAIQFLINLVLATPDWVLRLEEEENAERVMRRAEERFEQTSHTLTREADLNPQLAGFGTTLTTASSLGTDLFVAHVGDSRAYLLREGELHRLTRDHTSAQRLFDAGLIEEEEIATHRWRNRLTKMLGDKAVDARPDVQRFALKGGDQLLLCTDGLTDMVDDLTIADVLGNAPSADAACEQLVERALQAGGKDNVTVLVARYESSYMEGH